MDAHAVFEAAGLTPADLQALRDLGAEMSPLPDRERAAVRALHRAALTADATITRLEAQRRAALMLIGHSHPADDPGRIAVLFGQLKLILAANTDQPLDTATRLRLWDLLIGDHAYTELAQQAPGQP